MGTTTEIITTGLIVAALVGSGLFLWSPWVRNATTWRAMTTPLASIIGSGFLVLGPILNEAYGMFAPLAMLALCVAGYLFGVAMRYNIYVLAHNGRLEHALDRRLETAADWALGFAYIVSVAYYLNLFGAFGVRLTPWNTPVNAKLLTTAVFVVIAMAGWTRGFGLLERLEYVSVSAKLAVIAGLLVGLSVYFADRASGGQLAFNTPALSGWPALMLGFGLIVTVQGFETSRYLGDVYDAQTRITSMAWAQWLSSGIYMLYILLLAYAFPKGDFKLTETAIVDLMRIVAVILPPLLVIAALAAQFSAAVADTSGAGGLVGELTGNRMTPRMGYVVLAVAGIALTWSANVFEIISYASRAFAFYYGLQSALAALRAWRAPDRDAGRTLLFFGLAVLGMLIVLFGQPAEG